MKDYEAVVFCQFDIQVQRKPDAAAIVDAGLFDLQVFLQKMVWNELSTKKLGLLCPEII